MTSGPCGAGLTLQRDFSPPRGHAGRVAFLRQESRAESPPRAEAHTTQPMPAVNFFSHGSGPQATYYPLARKDYSVRLAGAFPTVGPLLVGKVKARLTVGIVERGVHA